MPASIQSGATVALLLILFFFARPLFLNIPASLAQETGRFQLAQSLSFNSWRPYNNPNRLISVGMNKGEVIAVAGKPDREESYYQSPGGPLTRVSDWYYIRTGENAETTLLKFVQESLVSITSTPTR